MRKLALSALLTIGIGLAASTAASAAPLSSGATGLSTAAISASLVEEAQYYRGRPRVRCRNVRVCRWTPYGRRCHYQRVCRRVW